MKRMLLAGTFVLSCWIAAADVASAQVLVRAPFVRVQVGPGVSVQAPFFNFYAPPPGPDRTIQRLRFEIGRLSSIRTASPAR